MIVRRILRRQLPEDAEAIQLGHLDVEKQQVRRDAMNHRERLVAVGGGPTTSMSGWRCNSSSSRTRAGFSSSTTMVLMLVMPLPAPLRRPETET